MQTRWLARRAEVLGGRVWQDGPLLWIDGPDGLNLMFPTQLPATAVARGVAYAVERGRPIVGVWLGAAVDTSVLADAGFEAGWEPCWMTAPIGPAPSDPRIVLREDSDDYDGEWAFLRERFALARIRPKEAWYAAAYDAGEFAGHAWSFRDGRLAGVFDMDVWEPFRRRKLGTGLLAAVCAASGAEHAVLNATPEGKLLYTSAGFHQIGAGITWWLHLR